ncbi:MAG: hypothetical protein ABI422_03140 [Sphingomicrobium sp.]
MDIKRLEPGKDAVGTDRIFLVRLRDGGVAWKAAIEVASKMMFGGDNSVCATVQEAEAEALEWVKQRGAKEITIVTNRA